MASMWRKAMHYLGLGPDEDYDDYDLLGGGDPDHAMRREPVPREAHHVREAPYREPAQREPVRRPMPSREREPDVGSTVRTLSSAARAGAVGPEPVARGTAATAAAAAVNGHSAERPAPRPRPTVVRPLAVPPSVKPHAVSPVTFTDAQEVADQFKRSVPVIVNLQGVERDLMRRIIDFSSGLCYGLSGQMERVANHVYLLTPSDVEVSPEERQRLRDRGYEA